jgi:hypothetical protein
MILAAIAVRNNKTFGMPIEMNHSCLCGAQTREICGALQSKHHRNKKKHGTSPKTRVYFTNKKAVLASELNSLNTYSHNTLARLAVQ